MINFTLKQLGMESLVILLVTVLDGEMGSVGSQVVSNFPLFS